MPIIYRKSCLLSFICGGILTYLISINFTSTGPPDSKFMKTLTDIEKLIDTSRKEQNRLEALLEKLELRNQANVDVIDLNPTQTISECSCERPFFYPPHNHRRLTLSSCSDEGTFHTTSQKVVTFTMYYNKKLDKSRTALYKEGIETNLKRMRELYPGHTMRLYTDVTLEKDYCNFVCNNSDLFWCDIRKTPNLGNMSEMYFRTWRFLTLGDPTVGHFLCRDLDSIITEREAAVVDDWLKLNKPIHVLRDKKIDHNAPILAGLWGARNDLLGEITATKLRDQIIRESKVMKGRFKQTDQKILRNLIFYPRRKDIVAYDSYHCKYWKKFTMVRPFPKQRKNNVSDFTGNLLLGRRKYNLSVCPDECKPVYGKDWKYC